jgi:hypothetical protein
MVNQKYFLDDLIIRTGALIQEAKGSNYYHYFVLPQSGVLIEQAAKKDLRLKILFQCR